MGTFIGLNFSKSTLDGIEKFQQAIGLKNIVNINDIHTTVLCSLDDIIDFKFKDFKGLKISEFKLGKMKTQKGIDCLVIEFNEEMIIKRHEEVLQLYNVVSFYGEFKGHISLSYDCGDMDISNIDIKTYLNELEVENEYFEELKFETCRRLKNRL
jgi:hypothetical protein